LIALAGCGRAALPAPSATVEEGGPPPAPTDLPTQTPQPTTTPVPTNTEVPTATPPPPTPTPLPPSPTKPPLVAYPPNPYERLSALRSYHLQFSVKTDAYEYSLAGDEATPNYHVKVAATPLTPAMELFFVTGRYVSSLAGGPFVDSGSAPPPQAAVLEAAEEFARGWFDHPDAAQFKGLENANGVPANHFVLTWKAGRPVAFGAISSTTYDPTTGDVWLDAASGAIVKAAFSMRVGAGAEVSTIVTKVDLTNINRPVTITPPPAQQAPAGG